MLTFKECFKGYVVMESHLDAWYYGWNGLCMGDEMNKKNALI